MLPSPAGDYEGALLHGWREDPVGRIGAGVDALLACAFVGADRLSTQLAVGGQSQRVCRLLNTSAAGWLEYILGH